MCLHSFLRQLHVPLLSLGFATGLSISAFAEDEFEFSDEWPVAPLDEKEIPSSPATSVAEVTVPQSAPVKATPAPRSRPPASTAPKGPEAPEELSPGPTGTTAASTATATKVAEATSSIEHVDEWTKKIGERITLRATKDKVFIKAGETMVVLDQSGKLVIQSDASLDIESRKDILLKAHGDIRLEAGGRVVTGGGSP